MEKTENKPVEELLKEHLAQYDNNKANHGFDVDFNNGMTVGISMVLAKVYGYSGKEIAEIVSSALTNDQP